MPVAASKMPVAASSLRLTYPAALPSRPRFTKSRYEEFEATPTRSKEFEAALTRSEEFEAAPASSEEFEHAVIEETHDSRSTTRWKTETLEKPDNGDGVDDGIGTIDDEETHSKHCFCSRKLSLKESAIEEHPEVRIRELLDNSHEPLLIKKGDEVDLERLLFTPERDYLMKSDGQKVHKHDLLNNKYILLYIFPLIDGVDMRVITRELIKLRNLLLDKAFEIVFVGLPLAGHFFEHLSADLSASLSKDLSADLAADLSAHICVNLSSYLSANLSAYLSANLSAHLSAFLSSYLPTYHYVNLSEQEYFKEHISHMTWPFIPYDDHASRQRVRSIFGFSETFVKVNGCRSPYLGIFDSHGKLLQSWASEMLNYYGPVAFPFTDEKITSLYKEEASMFTEGVSLNDLLGSPNRDYVLSPNGGKVPIQIFEDKVVCIILDDPARDPMNHVIKEAFDVAGLHSRPNFVPVYVCRHFIATICGEEYIEKEGTAKVYCESVEWHRIPCNDSSARKIWRAILRHCKRNVGGTYFNVVRPHGNYVNCHALDSIKEYGIRAYPFTATKAMELNSKKVELQLEDVLQPACHIIRDGGLISVVLHPDCLIPRNAIKFGDASVLYNKRLLVLFGTHSCCELGQFLCKLKLLYNQKKGTDEEFEVIYISFDCLRSDFDESTRRMPWVVFPFEQKDVMKLDVFDLRRPWSLRIPAIAAFERNGVLVGMEGNLHLKKDKPPGDFPFVNSPTDEFSNLFQSFIPPFPMGYRFWSKF